MNEYNVIFEVEREIDVLFSLDVNFTYNNVIQNVIQTITHTEYMILGEIRSGKVVITTDPQIITFTQGGIPTPMPSAGWVIAFPICLDSTGAEVSPVISSRTAGGFTVSIGDTSGSIEYIAVHE